MQYQNLRYDGEGRLIVHIDGACLSNGIGGRAQAGYGVWFNHNHPLNISAPVNGKATNNEAEIQAATQAIRQTHDKIGVDIVKLCTDSQFLINCATKWIRDWKKKNWMTTDHKVVKNKESLEQLDSAMSLMQSVVWEHVDAHQGVEGNEQADSLAKKGAAMYEPEEVHYQYQFVIGKKKVP